MTCQRCNYQWCWLCRGRYYEFHYSWINPIGCPGSHFSEDRGRCFLLTITLINLIFLPITLFVVPFFVMTGALILHFFFKQRYCGACPCIICFPLAVIFWPIFLICGIIVGSLTLVLGIIPCYIILFYRLFGIIFCNYQYCLR